MRGFFHLIGGAVAIGLVAMPCFAGEFAILSTGSRLEAERHEMEGGKVRLIHAGGGETILPAVLVVGFEEVVMEKVPSEKTGLPGVRGIPPAEQSVAPLPQTPRDLADLAAKKYSLPEAFVRSVMSAESGFQPKALSPKGAIGLMQLMPGTAKDLGVNPHDPEQNALGGAKYLHDLLAKYEGHPDQVLLALAAYNAGPAAVEKYRGVPPYAETRQYIWRVVNRWLKETSANK